MKADAARQPYFMAFFAKRILVLLFVGGFAVLVCELVEQAAMISRLTESFLRLAFWALFVAVWAYSTYRTFTSAAIRWAALAFAIVSSLGFVLAATDDILSLGGTPVIGSDEAMWNATRKIVVTGWACSVAYLFFLLLRSLEEAHRELQTRIEQAEEDMQQRRRAEVAWRDSERLHRTVLEQHVDGTALIMDGQIVYANPMLASMTGYQQSDLVGKKPSELMIAKDGSRCSRYVNPLLSGASEFSSEFCLQRADGGRVAVEVRSRRIHYHGSTALLSFVRDLTERKRAEASVGESHCLTRAIIESTTDVLCVQDLRGRYQLINPSGARFFGLTEGQVIGKTDDELFAPGEGLQSQHDNQLVLSSGRPHTRETQVSIGDRSRVFHVNRTPYRDGTGELVGVISVGRDVTELKEAEDVSRKQLSELAHVTRLSTLGEMVTGLAHELNQPLSAIANYADAAEQTIDREEKLPEDRLRSLASQISEQAFRAGEIIRRLRNLVRRSEPSRTTVRVNELITEVIELVAMDVRLNCIDLQLELAESDPKVTADRIQIQQVVLNLARNAIDALTDQQLETRTIQVKTCVLEDQRIEVVVRDSGIGAGAEVAPHVFEPFFSTKPDGMGMGLAISRTIVETHGGEMSFCSEKHGTTVRFVLPPGRRSSTRPTESG